jgi:hypothetical protein
MQIIEEHIWAQQQFVFPVTHGATSADMEHYVALT